MKKRLLSILLATAVLLSLAVPTAFAVDGTVGTDSYESTVHVNNRTGGGIDVTVTSGKNSTNQTYTILVLTVDDEYRDNYATVEDAMDGNNNAADVVDNTSANEAVARSTISYDGAAFKKEIATLADGVYYVIAWPTGEAVGTGVEIEMLNNKLKVPQCEITWDLNYTGAAAATKGTQDQGGTVTLPTAPTRAGYIFKGWFDAADAGNEITGASTVPASASVTYYAQWTEKADPTVPTTNAVTYKNGLKLSDVTLNGGTGTWAWTTGATPLTVTTGTTYEAKVAETTTHKAATANVNVVVNKGAVTVTGAAQGRIDKTLASIDLAGKVTVKDANNNTYTLPPKSITWKDDTEVIAEGKNDHTVVIELSDDDAKLYDLAPNGEYSIEVEGVDKNPTDFNGVKDLTGKVGETLTPNVTATSGKPVTYSSDNEDIVKVEDGKLVLVSVGKATITVSVEGDADWAENSTTFEVNVIESAEPHDAFMFGYANTNLFGPDDNLTRAQAVTILARLDGWEDGQAVESDAFSDVKAGVWYYDAVCYAKENGIAEGFKDGTFGPDKPITRAEFTKMLASMDLDGAMVPDEASTLEDAKDHWATKWIAYIEANFPGSITGRQDGKFYPDDKITRAEVAKIVNGYYGDRLQSVSAQEEDQLDASLNKFDDVIRCTWYYNNVIEATKDHDASNEYYHTAD